MLAALPALPAALAQYQIRLPGYRYEFPRDHFNHPGLSDRVVVLHRQSDGIRRPSLRF